MKRRKRTPTTEERLAGLREVIRAANGDWHEATLLYSVQGDISWLLSEAEARAAAADEVERRVVIEFATMLFKEVTHCLGCDLDHSWDDHVMAVYRAALARRGVRVR